MAIIFEENFAGASGMSSIMRLRVGKGVRLELTE
jgi:hypothetical protein